MKRRIKHIWVAILVASLAVPATLSRADEKTVEKNAKQPGGQAAIKPVAVISVASLDKLLEDAIYLTRAAGVPEFGAWFALTVPAYTEGVTKNRPAGGYIIMDKGEPKGVAFVPVDDLKKLLANLREEIGEPKDLGNGILEIASDQPNPILVKEQEGWAFFSNNADNLRTLPKDPSKLLGGLYEQYSIAVRVHLQNMPAEFKDVVLTQLKTGFESSLEGQLDGLEGKLKASTEKVSRRVFQSWLASFEQSEQFTVGWGIDSKAKSTHLDISIDAQKESDFAKKLHLLGQAKSSHLGFLLPDAAMSLHFSGKINQQDAELIALVIQTARDKRIQKLKNNNNIDAEKLALRKDILDGLVDVARTTIQSGKFDGGAALILSSGSPAFALGGYVSNGAALEQTWKKAVELGKGKPDFPEIQFNADTYQGLRIHTFNAPLKDVNEKARALLGDSLEGAVAIGGKSAYLVYGKDGIATLKKIIDQSQAGNGKKTAVGQLNIALAPIMKFASTVQEEPVVALLAAALENANGTDHLSLTASSQEQGLTLRLTIEEGVLMLIGRGLKTVLNNGGGPGF